jgi:hypothetical protein
MADDKLPDDDGKPGPTPSGPLDTLQMVFTIVACLGAFFYFRGPAHNNAQLLFRLGVMGVGAVGLLVVTVLKLTRQRRP